MADATKTKEKELDSFRKTILELLPDAKRILKKALKIPRVKKDKETKKEIKVKPIPPKSVDLARYVLEQYAKLVMPTDSDVNQFQVIDKAALDQMEEAKDIISEINDYNNRERKD